MASVQWYWHCFSCGAHDPADEEVSVDLEERIRPAKCACGGWVRLVTIRMGAAGEQAMALGLGEDEAWTRARAQSPWKMKRPPSEECDNRGGACSQMRDTSICGCGGPSLSERELTKNEKGEK